MTARSTIFILLFFISQASTAETIRIAVASNFNGAIKEIVKNFETNSKHKVILSFGSTGKHYAQIKNGAPFDVFLAADKTRPKLLEDESIAIKNSRFTYAIGQLVLWSPDTNLVTDNLDFLKTAKFRHIAIANPKLAPYGKAAQETLAKQSLWKPLSKHLVRGENINQTFQFIKSGSAQLGFVALSQIKQPNKEIDGSYWIIPQSFYTPIEQQAVLLTNKPAVEEFISFLKSKQGLNIIRNYGYNTPNE